MAFETLNFIFDGISSSIYNLFLIDDGSSMENDFSIVEQNIEMGKSASATKSNILNIQEDNCLEFELIMASESALKRFEISNISNWLCPFDNKYRKLYILQDDMRGYYYNCKINKITGITYANYPHVLKCSVICDSQFLWSNPITKKITPSPLPYNFNFMNTSTESHMKPIYKIKCNKANGSITIANTTTSQNMVLSGLGLNEIITIDTEIQSISSSIGNLRLENFNKIFMTIPPRLNKMTLSGNISEFEMIYQIAKRLGA